MDTQSNLDRLTDCKNTLRWAIVQASHEEVEPYCPPTILRKHGQCGKTCT